MTIGHMKAFGEKSYGYLALPGGRPGPGVLVLHAWWGLNPFFKQFCNRLAAEGFGVFAPDLYGGEVAETIAAAKLLRRKLKGPAARKQIAAAADFLRSHTRVSGPRLGVIGFSLGAFLGMGFVTSKPKDVAAVVLFYGTGGDAGKSPAACLAHFAASDPYVSAKAMQKLKQQLITVHRPHDVYVYPGTGHWFFEQDRRDAYDAKSARLAWTRTVKFLKAHLP